MINLFEVAENNVERIKSSLDAAAAELVEDQSIVFQSFLVWVRANVNISINIRLFVLVELLNGEPYKNIYEWAAEQADLSGRRREDILRERLGPFYHRRLTFDAALADGQRIRYGCLNFGSAGLTQYGPYCIVLEEDIIDLADAIACWSGDSLQVCFLSDGSFDLSPIQASAVPYNSVQLLVGEECGTEAAKAPEEEWPNLLTSGDHYFEVALIGDVTRERVARVRVLRSEYDRIWELAFDNFSRRLDEAERALVGDFVQLRRRELSGEVVVEVVADEERQ